MEKLALDGVWLVAALGITYLVGVFTSQWFKDKLAGVPSELRTALKATESNAVVAMKDAQSKVVADITNLIHPAVKPAVAAPGASGAAGASGAQPVQAAPAAPEPAGVVGASA